VNYWAGLQSVHGFRCYDNTHVCKLIALYTANAYIAEREMSASACILALWVVALSNKKTLWSYLNNNTLLILLTGGVHR